jgi:hypothetical protein
MGTLSGAPDRGADRHAVGVVGRRPAEAQKLGGQVGLPHADLRDGIGEGDRRRVHDRRVLSDKCEPVSVSPYPARVSGCEKAAPLGESGGAGLLVGVAGLKVALCWKVVVDRGMD